QEDKSNGEVVMLTDAEKIADALRAGPRYITDHGTIADWDMSPTGKPRVLREGTNGWTCFPGVQGHDPMCCDETFFNYLQDAVAQRTVNVAKLGICYMYTGDTVQPH